MPTDRDALSVSSREGLSNAVKLLKPQIVMKVIQAYKMEQALIFVRTKIDADNLEQFFIALSGGKKCVFAIMCNTMLIPLKGGLELLQVRKLNIHVSYCMVIEERKRDAKTWRYACAQGYDYRLHA